MTIPRRDWLTLSEVAAQLDVTVQSVRNWILTGQLEGEQAGVRTWLVHESAVVRYIARRMATAQHRAATAHNRNTQPPITNGETSIRPSVSNGARAIEPHKRYRLKSTGEIVTGAELLRRRESEGNPE